MTESVERCNARMREVLATATTVKVEKTEKEERPQDPEMIL
jgi:hypothetical protein